ncbi:gamma-secretase-activating protein [Aplysia californica]|uniref:Gamma-secretase-activating protein n=1 Tax=Aplysia californica TaxID=6500 RepID=A0ABM0ZZE5_APLCA|nr:gamma-secretase-activating protein [Aplysia californica]
MFELHTTFDLLSSLSQFIYSYRQHSGISESLVITPRIINQEKGGAIIFVWNDVDKEKPASYVTNFGIYEPDTQKHMVIYTYDKKVKVVSCSMNKEQTLLAFSIVKPRESSSEKKHKASKDHHRHQTFHFKDVYQAYLAELQSVEKIVYSLNIDRSSFIKVQFLYADQQGQEHSRESNMLVFLHKESIGLYKVPMARIGDRGIMMSSQPETIQVVRKFVWCQWDVEQQRLHYIENIRMENGGNGEISQKMSTIQFHGRAQYENMIDIPINFPFPYIRTKDKPLYADIPLHPGIPELTLNVTVLTQSSGTFCLCYHKLISQPKSKASAQTPSEVQDVEYYVSMVHHAKTLYGCVSSLPKHIVMQKRLVFSWLGSYLVVMLPGYFVHLLNVGQAFEPCHHILLHDTKVCLGGHLSVSGGRHNSVKFDKEERDVDSDRSQMSRSMSTISASLSADRVPLTTPELSPELQLSPLPLLSPTSTTTPLLGALSFTIIPAFSESCAAMKTLLPCQAFARESGATTQNLYDYRSGCLLKLVVNMDTMLESFRNAYWQTRLAILHYLILHCKDVLAIRKVFEVLCENVTNAEINTMFTEYLVASTFAEMKRQVDREVLNLLSFTSIETLRGQYEKSPSGERLAHVSYSSLEIVELNKRPSREQKNRSNEDFWDTLIRRLRSRHTEMPAKFSHDSLMRQYRQAEMEEALGKTVWDSRHVPDSFFDGVYTLRVTEMPPGLRKKSSRDSDHSESSSGRRSKIDAVLGQAPLFLQTKITQESQIFKRRLSKMTEDHLTSHLSKFLRKESRSKAKNVAKEFLFCQAKVSRQLCHLIWSLRGQNLSHQLEDTLLPNLQDPGTDEEYELFQLYERLYLTAGDMGYPLPPGFSSFFTALGFKCLELHLFFQYVDNHVLILTPDFILQMLDDLPDDADDEVPQIKFQVISRLQKSFAEECFERWNHPITQQRKAREQVAQILLRGQQPTPMAPPDSGQGQGLTGRQSKESSGRHSTGSAQYSTPFTPLNTFMKHLDSLAANIPTSRPINYDTGLIEDTALYHTKTKTTLDMSTVNF